MCREVNDPRGLIMTAQYVGNPVRGTLTTATDASAGQPSATSGPAAQSEALAALVIDLQAQGLRVEVPIEGRRGGAGPADSGQLWVGGYSVTVPTDNATAANSPYLLRAEDEGYGIYRDGVRLADARGQARPRYYDLTTADGVPYWKIGLLHLDSFASTVVQACSYWGTPNQCTFCGIGLSLESGRTVAKKTPEQLAEVAVAAKELDGAVDATLTTGSPNIPDRGARYVGRCGQAVKQAAGLPVEVQFEPPSDLAVIDEIGEMGIDTVGIHIETFDPAVLARVAPGKARVGIERYFETWRHAVRVFGEGQVTTYVILGMGEDPDLVVEGCRRAIDIGVYPFVVPLRPVAGSLMADTPPPDPAYTNKVYRRVLTYMTLRGMNSGTARAGCARCQACSGLRTLEPMAQAIGQ
jgi:radical SAM protein (TIGR04043 family)